MPDLTDDQFKMVEQMAKSIRVLDIPKAAEVPFPVAVEMGRRALVLALASHICAQSESSRGRIDLTADATTMLMRMVSEVGDRVARGRGH